MATDHEGLVSIVIAQFVGRFIWLAGNLRLYSLLEPGAVIRGIVQTAQKGKHRNSAPSTRYRATRYVVLTDSI